jgi:hypothetical protein
VRLGITIASACLLLVLTPPAEATINSVFNGTGAPIACALQPDDVRLCNETADGRPRSTVKTFDGVPLQTSVAFPPALAGQPDRGYPLIMVFNGYGGGPASLARMQAWLDRGYATLTFTARGNGESCGTQASRDADPAGCAQGYARTLDTRYDVRDAQELAGLLVDEGLVDPQRIGATGRSYGGALSLALAALYDRKMLQDGTLVPWTSPRGTPMRTAATAPEATWSDYFYALLPNGGTLDYVADAPYQGRTGVLKQSWENALYDAGLQFFYAPPASDPAADFVGWHTKFNAGEPYDGSDGTPLPVLADIRAELTSHHSAYYIDHSEPPAPTLIANGWTDDLFPADEAIRFYNRTRTQYPSAPIALFLADMGHARADEKPDARQALNAREYEWMNHFVKGAGTPVQLGVQALTQTCPATAPPGGPYAAATWAAAAPGEVRIGDGAQQKIEPEAGAPEIGETFDPISGGDPCATVPAADEPGTATYRSQPVPAAGYTLLGSPTVTADITSLDSTSEIAARLLDVDPATDAETLVARGLWRPAISGGPVSQVLQLHPNGYRFAPGHVVKLELLPGDSPYGRPSNRQGVTRVAHLELRLPVVETPGALGGLVQQPAPKVLPPGAELARDFGPATYVRPRGATPVWLALVPAFAACVSPDTGHGQPLAFGSCRPPAQASPAVTVGTKDANGSLAKSTGLFRMDVIAGDPYTSADEADVFVHITITDVRQRADLTDYTGELEGRIVARITDQASAAPGGGDGAATVVDAPLSVAVPCAETPDPTTGGSCAVTTTVEAQTPGAVREGVRSVWQLGDAQLYDGGPDGLASTAAGNVLFARQGLFIP